MTAVRHMEGFRWFNEPETISLKPNGLRLRTQPKTDFWQRTHYGFRRDNGHCFLKTLSGNFTIQAKTDFTPQAQYDQCGLFARVDGDNWIKCSTEFETPNMCRLGSVVTHQGYSDWASQDIHSPITSMHYRLSRSGKDFLIENSTDGTHWNQMRVSHLHQVEETIEAGLYACSPVGDGFECSFSQVQVGPCVWDG